MRGLCKYAIAHNIQHLEVYRGKGVDKPRIGENITHIGSLINTNELLEDLMNSIGKYTSNSKFELGLPNSGRSVKIPI